MRILMTKDFQKFKNGEVVEVGLADGKDLLDNGFAEVTKDMTQTDYKSKGVKNGKSSKLRHNKRS